MLEGEWRASVETPAVSLRRLVSALPPNATVQLVLVGDTLGLQCGEFRAALVTRTSRAINSDIWSKGWQTRRWRKLVVTDLPLFSKRD
jgi:hypothetical protein